MKQLFLLIIITLLFQTGATQTYIEHNFESYFEKFGVEGCFILYNQEDNEMLKHNSALCDTGYIPASTFKIPNSLIALEERIIKDDSQTIKWNGHEWPHESWNQDQTLKTAIKHSCVWVYEGFAEQIGIDKYYEYIKAFDYGNKDLTGPPTRFWLAGNFRISATEQIEFLKKFYNNELPVSKNSTEIVKNSILLEHTDSYRLSGKAGGGLLSDTDYIMWLVGYIEKNNKPYFFAMNFISDNYIKSGQARYQITKDILRDLKLIE